MKDYKTTQEEVNRILSENGLDFHIEKVNLGYLNRLGFNESPYFGLLNCKTNEIINTVKEGYHVSQNKDLVELTLKGIEKFGTDLKLTKAGSLNGGRKVFIQAEIEGYGNVGNDRIKRFVTILDSNDGTTSLSVGIGDLTMSCSNQFYKFYKKGEAKFRHSASLAEKMKTIPFLIETALNESLRQIETYKTFQSTNVSRSLIHEIVKHTLGYDREITSIDIMSKKGTQAINTMDKLYNEIEREILDKGQNLWGLHSGITKYTTHSLNLRGQRENQLTESLLSGIGYKMNQNSLKFCEEKSGLLTC